MKLARLTLSPSSQAMLILAICGALIHFGSESAKRSALMNPRLQVLHRDPPAPLPPRAGAINIIQEAAISTSPPTSTLSADLPNKLFLGTSNDKPAEAKVERPIDHFTERMNNLRLDAITDNGIVIDGSFVAVGEAIHALAYPGASAPKLLAVSNGTASIREAAHPYRTRQLKAE